ncbi:hypothetical protein BD769DRAFT_1664360 [Suillus cothurnatus]|nr:hypothetical protein BD769DRAFT_1676515 [Suillus cothurnatus]KAG2121719.1 hypothetical protein BD769DRAFT_1671354 [Suillus cothurnatus]KAG2136821.1 hypothetical protein BD769DRAFT_1664360 [Suillus cothurnatus]
MEPNPYHFGYLYTPASGTSDSAELYEWFSNTLLEFATIETSYVKVAYARTDEHEMQAPNLRAGYPVYVDADQYPAVSPASLAVPIGWKQVAVYTDHDLITRKVLQVDPMNTRFSSNHSSVFDDSEQFMSTMSSLGEGHWMSDANSLVLGAPSDPVSGSGIRSTFLEVAPTISAMNSALSLIHTEPSYVSCVPEVFAQGIKYDNEFLKTYFPLAYISITDAKIMAKNRLNFRPHDAAPFRTYCAQVLVEMLTVAASAGQGSELGLRCNETGRTKQLNLQSSDAISLVFAERKTFLKSLKSYATAFVDDPNKERLGGYNIQNINGSTTEYIHMLTNMTNANEDVTSIIFTCDNQGRPYRREAILVLLAHRLLRPLANRGDSLLDLFPDDYSTFPEHLLSSICAMLVMVLRTRFPGEIPNKFATQAFIDEEGRQLALFRTFRNSTNPQAIELNTWLTTPLGPSGWRHDLQHALVLANSLRGPR